MTLDGRERFRRAAEGFETRHRLAVRKTQQAAAHQRKQKKSQEHAIQDACLPGPGLRKCAHTITALCSNRADQPLYGHIPHYIIPYHSCVKKATRKPREFVKLARIAGKPYFSPLGKGDARTDREAPENMQVIALVSSPGFLVIWLMRR